MLVVSANEVAGVAAPLPNAVVVKEPTSLFASSGLLPNVREVDAGVVPSLAAAAGAVKDPNETAEPVEAGAAPNAVAVKELGAAVLSSAFLSPVVGAAKLPNEGGAVVVALASLPAGGAPKLTVVLLSTGAPKAGAAPAVVVVADGAVKLNVGFAPASAVVVAGAAVVAPKLIPPLEAAGAAAGAVKPNPVDV